WTSARREKLELPLVDAASDAVAKALVFDWQSGGQYTAVQDLVFDAMGNPTIVYFTTSRPESGIAVRMTVTARWTGRTWETSRLLPCDNNFDTGALYFEKRSFWRLLLPHPRMSAEPESPGGEAVFWSSEDLGR